jgi:dUTP pyrophosphatase
MKIKLLSEYAKTPTKTPGNAGYDLYAAEAVIIPPGQRRLIKTDIALEIPVGYYGRIADRSGMAYKNGATCLAGVIDPVYRGNIGIVLHNTDLQKEVFINVGDRPAQIIFEKYHEFIFDTVEGLGVTERGNNGYGSSGGISISNVKESESTTQGVLVATKVYENPLG